MLHEKEMRSVDAEGLSYGFLQVKKQAGKKKSSALVGIEPTPGDHNGFRVRCIDPRNRFQVCCCITEPQRPVGGAAGP